VAAENLDFSGQGREDRLEIAFSDCSCDKDLHSDRASCLLHGCRIALGIRVVRIDQHRDKK
jgi:hypothetical protein